MLKSGYRVSKESPEYKELKRLWDLYWAASTSYERSVIMQKIEPLEKGLKK